MLTDYHCFNLKNHSQIQGRAQKKQWKIEIYTDLQEIPWNTHLRKHDDLEGLQN